MRSYELVEVGRGLYLRKSTDPSVVSHWCCPTCYDQGRGRSVLRFSYSDEDDGTDAWVCRVCPSKGLQNLFFVPSGLKP